MVKHKKKKIKLHFIGLLIIAVMIAYLSSLYFQSQRMLKQTISSVGYIKADAVEVFLENDSALIKLIGKCSELSFSTTYHQGGSIQLGLLRQIAFRPTTHDIMSSILDRYGIKPIIVKITRVEGGTYFAELTLRKGFNFMTIDIRPSDAVAIAVRTNTPIYVNESLMNRVC